MDNGEIARKFDLLAKVMELFDENPFKIRSYVQAYSILRKVEKPFHEMNKNELEAIQGVGTAIADKIIEIVQTGKMKTLDTYLAKTPPGIIEMLHIRGFGPKKVKQIWKELEIESIGELLYACNENRIAGLKGFGLKTQQELIESLQYAESSKNKFLFSKAWQAGFSLVEKIRNVHPEAMVELTGEISLQLPVVKGIEIITTIPIDILNRQLLQISEIDDQVIFNGIPVFFNCVSPESFILEKCKSSCHPDFSAKLKFNREYYISEEEIFIENNLPYIHPARRDNTIFLDRQKHIFPVIERKIILGCIHNHTTYSDGMHSLEDMCKMASDLKYEYIAITDHSQSAFYAQGLNEEKLILQWAEIDRINSQKSGCYILKGIESDILNTGDLDYTDDILARFDCVIASVHSNLKMDEEKATQRLIRAIEHPATKILGHPTGRLLLSRPGYPLKMDYIMDACARNGVAIELNANPRRLDIDYTFLDKLAEKEILISINPDAHSKEAIEHIQYGIFVAQKANLNPQNVINTWNLNQMMQWLKIQ